MRYRFPDGRPFENVGIHPDLSVPLTVAHLRNGRDAALDRALEHARATPR